MPRAPRCRISGVPQLLFQMGHNGGAIFHTEPDYRTYLCALEESAASTGCRVHAYSLARDRLYLLCTPLREDGVSRLMQGVSARYGYYFNRERGRSGSLWDSRYRACLIEPGRFLLATYLFVDGQLGPTAPPGANPWSSRACHTWGRADSVVQDHWVYLRLGSGEVERQRTYRELLDVGVSPSLRGEIESALRSNVVLGHDAFKDEIASRGYKRVRVGKPGRPRRPRAEHRPLRTGPRAPAPALMSAAPT